MTYASGEQPKAGDVVEAVRSFQGAFDSLVQGEVYRVHAVALHVHLRGQKLGWMPDKFKLISRQDEDVP